MTVLDKKDAVSIPSPKCSHAISGTPHPDDTPTARQRVGAGFELSGARITSQRTNERTNELTAWHIVICEYLTIIPIHIRRKKKLSITTER
jgi:hypothetical protein